MTDDLSMKALKGSLAERSHASVKAGCDMILHCNGNLDEMRKIAHATPDLSGIALSRADAALGWRQKPDDFDIDAAKQQFHTIMHKVA